MKCSIALCLIDTFRVKHGHYHKENVKPWKGFTYESDMISCIIKKKKTSNNKNNVGTVEEMRKLQQKARLELLVAWTLLMAVGMERGKEKRQTFKRYNE